MTPFQSSNVRLEATGPDLATLWLDVAERSVNVFNRQVIADLDAALDHVAADPAIKVLALRSAKPSGFIAGTVSGAPLIETGPKGLPGCRDIRLRAVNVSRPRPEGMDDVNSGASAFCSESTFAISEVIWVDIFFTSPCSSAIWAEIFFTSERSSVRLCRSVVNASESCAAFCCIEEPFS